MKHVLALAVLLMAWTGSAAEVIPPAPTRHFNDYAQVVSPKVANYLDQQLEAFERESSSQIVVAVFSRMSSDSSIEDYTVRVARAWKVGLEANDNGAVLFVFVENRQLFIQVGYGLEGVLPDALCKRIIEEQITPHFRTGDFDAGLTAGVQGLIAAARGEYRGTGRTAATQRRASGDFAGMAFAFILLLVIFIIFLQGGLARRGYSSWGRRGWTVSSGSGGGWSGGFGGGGFSGGGGSFGGGGAGGRW